MSSLKDASTLELAQELAKRADLEMLVNKDGLVNPDIWNLRSKLGAVGCVDGVAIRRNGNTAEGGVIRRGTSKFAGKLALVGGVIARYESIEDAMKRHWRADLGFEIDLPLGWDCPVCMRQYAPQVNGENRPEFCHDPGKHSYASTHLVVITNGDGAKFGTKIGGQEATDFLWFTAENCPPEEEWAYNMRDTFLEVLAAGQYFFNRGFILIQ